MAMAPRSMTSLLSFIVTISALRSKIFIGYLSNNEGTDLPCLCSSESICPLDKSHLVAPVLRILEKIDDLLTRFFTEIALAQAGIQDVIPIGEHMQCDIVFRQIQLSFVLVQTIRSIIKDTQTVRHPGARASYADIETQLAETVRYQVFHQHHALARLQNPFDLFGATITFRLFANINHRFLDQMRHERGVRDACGFTARDHIEFVQTDIDLRLVCQCIDDELTVRSE